jgi:hypothetical protein
VRLVSVTQVTRGGLQTIVDSSIFDLRNQTYGIGFASKDVLKKFARCGAAVEVAAVGPPAVPPRSLSSLPAWSAAAACRRIAKFSLPSPAPTPTCAAVICFNLSGVIPQPRSVISTRTYAAERVRRMFAVGLPEWRCMFVRLSLHRAKHNQLQRPGNPAGILRQFQIHGNSASL